MIPIISFKFISSSVQHLAIFNKTLYGKLEEFQCLKISVSGQNLAMGYTNPTGNLDDSDPKFQIHFQFCSTFAHMYSKKLCMVIWKNSIF